MRLNLEPRRSRRARGWLGANPTGCLASGVSLRVLFYGSIDNQGPSFGAVEDNVSSLVDVLIKKKAKFVCRSVTDQPDPTFTPVDTIVLGRISGAGERPEVTVFHEPGAQVQSAFGFRVKDYTASSSERRTFYQELLGLVDVVIGIGGQRGLIRMEMSCELYQVPILVLPGSGGAADILWAEMFTRSPQFLGLPATTQNMIRSLPYASSVSSSYGKRCFQVLEQFVDDFKPAPSSNSGLPAINLSSYGIGDLAVAMKRLSLAAWITVGGALIALLGLVYGIGYSHVIDRIAAATERLLNPK